MEQQIPGYTIVDLCPAFSLFIKNTNPNVRPKYDHLILDLAFRKSFIESSDDTVVERMKAMSITIEVIKDVADLVAENRRRPI